MVKSGIVGRMLPVVVHCVRTTVAAVVSLLMARVLGLPEAYWAPVDEPQALGSGWEIPGEQITAL